jgi:hypothetical protein
MGAILAGVSGLGVNWFAADVLLVEVAAQAIAADVQSCTLAVGGLQ